MRKYLIDDILSSFYYRDDEGRKFYTVIVGILFSREVVEIKRLGFDVQYLNPSYNLIIFKENIYEKNS